MNAVAFIPQVTIDDFDGNARKTENEMGWGRGTIQKKMDELKTGIRCIDHYFDEGQSVRLRRGHSEDTPSPDASRA